MPALEPLHGARIVADAAAVDAAVAALPASTVVVRSAPDELLVIGSGGVTVDDPHAIVEDERGFVGGWCAIDDVRPHVEWALPTDRPALAQGALAGVPARLWIAADDRVLVVASVAHAVTLAERLGWSVP